MILCKPGVRLITTCKAYSNIRRNMPEVPASGRRSPGIRLPANRASTFFTCFFRQEGLSSLQKDEGREVSMPSPCFKAVLFFFAFAALFISSSAAAPSLKDNLDSVFSEIKQDFEQIAASPEAQSGTAAELDKYFFEALKRNQPYYSLLRIDRKGFAVSEVIRMVEKPGVKKRKVTGESWYKYVSKKLKEYNGTIKQEENGRYYLFWAIPIIYTNKKGKESFAGAVALKVDFWDCFQRFTKNTQTPFSVRMGRMGFFSYLWSNDIAFIEAPLSIPGAKKMKV